MKTTLLSFLLLCTLSFTYAQDTEIVDSNIEYLSRIDVNNDNIYIYRRVPLENISVIDKLDLNLGAKETIWEGKYFTDLKVVEDTLYYCHNNIITSFPLADTSMSSTASSSGGYKFNRLDHNNGKMYLHDPINDILQKINKSISGQSFNDVMTINALPNISFYDNHLYMMTGTDLYKINELSSTVNFIDTIKNINNHGLFEVHGGYIITSNNVITNPSVRFYDFSGNFVYEAFTGTGGNIIDIIGSGDYIYFAVAGDIHRISINNLKIDEIDGNQIFNVYNDLATSVLSVISDNEINNIKIYSLTGSLVHSVDNINTINISSLTPGSYILMINNSYSKKIIKM